MICRTGAASTAPRAAFGKVAQYAASAEVGEAATFAIADMDARLGRFHKARKELGDHGAQPLTGNRARILWSLGWIHYRRRTMRRPEAVRSLQRGRPRWRR